MKLEQSFEVRAPIDVVWKALIDVERVAPCLPGAEITEVAGDGTYHGDFTVKLGPTTASYRGKLEMESREEAAHRVTMRASGQDKRGQGSAKATIVSALSSSGDATRVDVETDFTITGRLARFGRGGMIHDISNRLLREFAGCLQKSIEAPAEGVGAAAGASASEARAEHPGGGPFASATAPPPPAKPIRGISLFFSVLWERIRRLFGRRR